LEKDPARRLGSLRGILELKEHSFLKDFDFSSLPDLESPYKPNF